jgi:hypothetical protein
MSEFIPENADNDDNADLFDAILRQAVIKNHLNEVV